MNAGEPVYIRASYLGRSTPERVGGETIETILVRVEGSKRPVRVPKDLVEPVERRHIRMMPADWDTGRDDLALAIRRTRQRRNLSQSELAERVGVSQRTVSKWENGEVIPRSDRLAALAAVLGVSMSEMLEAKRVVPV